jgi:hypothetical protein
MRCPKCGNEVDLSAMECARCGLSTPKGGKPATGSLKGTGSLKKGNTGQLSTGKLKKPAAGSYLPKFIADLPLAKINVSSKLIVPLVLIFPLAAILIYLNSTNQICIGCVEVSGKYATDLSIEDKKVHVEMKIAQMKGMFTGQVLLMPEQPAAPQPGDPAPATAPLPRQFVEMIQSGSVNNNNINFHTFPKENISRVQFSGQLDSDSNTLKGDLKLTVPELNCNGKTFPIAVKKS